MRFRARDQKTIAFHPLVPTKEPDGTTSEAWSEVGIPVTGVLQPAGGKTMAEMYGNRLAYMLIFYVSAGEPVTEGAGACVYTANKPDYRVIAIQKWSHWEIHLEAI